jgi:glycosyltransferase involved in cell wall biosynthesis
LPATSIRSIAIIDPMGDTGIGGYVYELAEGLAANQRQVDVYTNDRAIITRYPLRRHHRVFPVLGSALLRQREILNQGLRVGAAPPLSAKAQSESSRTEPKYASESRPGPSRFRRSFLAWELAVHLWRQGYDLVWTQWPEPVYGARFHWACRRLGLKVAHTVHNILPHEEAPGDRAVYEGIYRNSDWLLVHSQQTRSEMAALFPRCGSKVILVRHGLYTMYPQPSDGTPELRRKLGIPAGKTAALFFGGIRPYKNIDAALVAMADDRCKDTVLVVAGKESGYVDLIPGQRLGRTRRMAAEFGIADRVILIEPPFDLRRTAELMVAADILLLPYRKSYGSGLLLLGMTFGKHIVATRTGGIEEYLTDYPRHTLLQGDGPADVAAGIEAARAAMERQPPVSPERLAKLQWRAITGELLVILEAGVAAC